MIVTDVSQLPERHKRELLRGERAQAELDILLQRRLKEASDRLESRHIEGLGQKVICIHPNLAWRLRLKYGMSCLHDPDFRKSLLRKNPFLRVKSVARKMAIRVDGFRVQGSGFRKEKSHAAPGTGEGAQLAPATPFRCPAERDGRREIVSGHAVPGARSGVIPPETRTLNPEPCAAEAAAQ